MPSTASGNTEYDPKSRCLWVLFVANDRRYVYFDVPIGVYDDFRHAFSKGTFFNRHIRDRYGCELVEDPVNAGLSAREKQTAHFSDRI